MAETFQLGFLGAGNMAEGILGAVLERKLYRAKDIMVSDPAEQRRTLFGTQFGVTATDDNRRLAGATRRIVLAVKPQTFAEVAEGIADLVTGEQLLVSIMAGLSTEKIEQAFPGNPRVVRVMPNLPIRLGDGMAGLCGGSRATPEDLSAVKAIFDAGGRATVIEDESLMDVVTAMSGSGPAYFYYFVESMVAGGVACGLNEAQALELAEQTCLGAARMMLETKEPPAELRRKVTSKGGTTQAALEYMNSAGVGAAIRDAVKAAFDRGRELGR